MQDAATRNTDTLFSYVLVLRLNQLEKVTVGDPEQLSHIVQLDVRDSGLTELDVSPLSRLEVLRCDRNSISHLRVSGCAIKGLHAAHNGNNVTFEIVALAATRCVLPPPTPIRS